MALRDEVHHSLGNFQLLLGYKLACVSDSYKCICELALTRTLISTLRVKTSPVIIDGGS